MKRTVILALIFVLGGISGIAVQYSTYGTRDRARIAALEDELKSRNDRLDKCTDALINGLRTNSPQTAPPIATNPK